MSKLAADYGHPVYLVGLPQKAEAVLGHALALPRVCCVAFRRDNVTHALLDKVKARVPLPTSGILARTEYRELRVKTLISSAPIVPKIKTTSGTDTPNKQSQDEVLPDP